MKNLVFLLVFLFFSCKKQNDFTYEKQELNHYGLSVIDERYNYLTDTIIVIVNNRRVNHQTYSVLKGDSVSVYYNPGLDSCGNIDLNTLKIVYNGGEIIVKEFNCHCFTKYKFKVE